jgi:hypothetical protein
MNERIALDRLLLHGNFLAKPASIIFRRDVLEAADGFNVKANGRGRRTTSCA